MELIKKEGMTLMRRKDGYVNAPALCKQAGKLFADYQRLATSQEFLVELSSDMGIPISQLVFSLKGNSKKFEQGTYVHPLVAVNLGQWLSPRFAVFVSMVIEGRFLKPLSQEAAGLVRPRLYSWSPYPQSLKGPSKVYTAEAHLLFTGVFWKKPWAKRPPHTCA